MFDFKHRMADLVEQALRLEYPNMKGLVVVANEDETLNVRFEDDGIHSKQQIEDFLNKLRNDTNKT